MLYVLALVFLFWTVAPVAWIAIMSVQPEINYVSVPPHLRNTLAFAILLETIVSLQVFDLIYTLTRGGPGQGTVLLSYLVYINAFERLSLGRAAAMAVLLALLIMGLSALSLSLMMRRKPKALPIAKGEA